MIVALVLLVAGLVLSAFFSGAETGFYRATRLRLVIDALSGDWIARGLLWLSNHPSMFVATTLVGNNIANYMASLAIVIGAQLVFTGESHWPELIAPLLFAPVVFIYGELMPKHVFHDAPNRMLRKCGPALLVCTWVFLPISGLLWILAKSLQRLMGSAPQPLQLVLARRELEKVFEEGHDAGILGYAQRGLAQKLFAMANQPLRQFALPAGRIAHIHTDMSKADVLRLARRHRAAALPVEEGRGSRRLLGYIRIADLYLDPNDQLPPLRPLVVLSEQETYISALMRLQRSGELLGRVVDAESQTVGFITARQLSTPLFRGR